jgi:hypothetical protein
MRLKEIIEVTKRARCLSAKEKEKIIAKLKELHNGRVC